ncbi:rod shape-determining protein MreD [Endozoicomonas sp. SCSIO W0465]|uniref:rod shape-determining protein MreD n=1 Tax=Endozoicomonas sp. SCSIO W0465 TaxID=2918516 RepID=UPI0020755CCB|nr:rod shape-determining protein MreD [Endozoicomonas sp. SCSIO W0465]USE35046.1 rod shape-determining protein MreD [Endozoicomonas sp. SCSIO W0465]
MVQQSNAHWVVWMTLLVGAVFSIMPLPEWLSLVRPAWLPLVVIYWVLALPERFGLFFAFIAGLLLDVFQGSLFGLNSLGMLVVVFIVLSLHRRLRLFPVWQQAFMVFLMIGFYQLLLLWARSAVGGTIPSVWYLLPSISSALVWPWMMSGLRFLRRYFRVV